MKNNKNTDIQITSLIFISLMALVSYDILLHYFVIALERYSFAVFNLYLAQILLLVNTLTTAVLLLNKPKEDRWTLSPKNMLTLFKVNLLSMILLGLGITNFFTLLPAVLMYECAQYAQKDSWMARYLEKANQKQWAISRFFQRCVLLPLILILGGITINELTLLLGVILFSLLPYHPAVFILFRQVPFYLGIFLCYLQGAKLMGYSPETIFTLPTDKPRQQRMFSDAYRNFKWALMAFAMTVPTIFFPLYISGLFACLVELYSALTNVHYLAYTFATLVHYTIQPFFEEVLCRSLFYRYAVTQDLCPKDYQDMSHTHKITYSILNGFLFAIMHSVVIGSVHPLVYLYHTAMGIGFCMLAFLSGKVDMAGYVHSFHNIACALSYTFVRVWHEFGLPIMAIIGGFIANPLRYYLITSMESDYISAEDKAEASRQAQLKDRAKRKPAWAVIPVSKHPESVIPMPASSAA